VRLNNVKSRAVARISFLPRWRKQRGWGSWGRAVSPSPPAGGTL